MKRTLVLAALMTLTFAFFGFQAPPPPKPAAAARPTPSPTPLPVLEGTVKGPDGKPVEKALVLARPVVQTFGETPLHARTDATGRFQIRLKSTGLHNVRVEAAGLAAKTLEKVRAGAPLAIALGKGGTIEGVVRDSQNALVPKARVTARDEAGFGGPGLAEPEAGLVRATTDAKGQFRLEGLGPGLHTVTARARGVGYGRRSSVRLGSRVDLLLLPGATLFGRVTGPGGQSVAGAIVTTEREERALAGDAPVETTDANGQFEVVGLSPATYWVVVRHKDFAPGVVTGVAIEKEASAKVDVALVPGVRVTGRLVDGEGRPLVGKVQVQELEGQSAPRSLAGLLWAEAGANGRFELPPAPAGSYVFGALAPGHAAQRVEATIPAQGRAAVDVGDVVLEVGLAIRGRARDKAGAGLAGVNLSAFPARPLAGLLNPSEAQSEADGRFVLAGLSEGPYRITARLSGYAESVQQASPGAEGIEIVLSPGGAITGVVVDESNRPIETFSVDADPTRRASAQGVMIRGNRDRVVDPDGRFTLADLSEGTYVVRAEAPETVAGSISDVKVVAGQTTDAGRIRLSRGGTVRGSVVDAGGTPVPGATVFARGTGNELMFRGQNPATTTDASGLFEARGVPPGKVDVVAAHPNYATGRVAVEVDPAKGPAEARVVLTQGGRIEGWARKRDGAPLSGRVQVMPAQMMGADMATQPSMASLGADGSFAVDHVAPGRWRVMLLQGTAGRLASTLSKEVDVREGETTSAELTSRDILVSGRVTRGGVPQPGLRVNLRARQSARLMMSFGPGIAPPPSAGPQRGTAVTREDGSYELLIDEPGQAMADVETLDGKTDLLSRTETIPDADSHVADFALAGVSVSGVVIDKQTEKGVAEANVSAVRKGGGGAVGAETGTDGRFTMEVEPGEIRLSARAQGYAPEALEVSVGQGGLADLRLDLSKADAIEGRVLDAQGRAVPGIPLTATSGGPREARSSGLVMTLADGSFRFDSVANKPHAILAGSGRAGFAFRPSVSPGAKDLALTLRPGGKTRVRVVGPDGQPVEGASVRLESMAGVPVNIPFGNATTDAQGFADVDLPAGAVELEGRKDELRGQKAVNVAAGGMSSIEITIKPKEAGSP